MNPIEAFPLQWPKGRNRTKYPARARFHSRTGDRGKKPLTIASSRDRVQRELSKLGAKQVVISSNLRLRMDGELAGNQNEPQDSGVAVYFQLNKLPHCLSCDTWDRAADNLAAIAKHVEAMRGQLRCGVADVATMFSGFKALPGAIITPQAMTPDQAAEVISRHTQYTAEQLLQSRNGTVEDAYRAAAKIPHPDFNGGQERQDWHDLQEAIKTLRNLSST